MSLLCHPVSNSYDVFQTAKNLVLAGMNVTIQDDANLETEDMSALYFASMEEVGQKVTDVIA